METEDKMISPIPLAIEISKPLCQGKCGLEQVTWQRLTHKQMLIWMLIKIYKPDAIFWIHTLISYLLNIFQVQPSVTD